MEFRNYSSPHLPGTGSVPLMMRQVLLALLPGIACAAWFFGWGILINILLAGSAAMAAEAGMLALRRRPVADTLLDGSALLTGVLLALALPPLTPWWIPVIGSLFAIVIAKQLYGGLGYNPFNPAMIGYVVLLISFPLELTLWSAPGQSLPLADTLALVFSGTTPAGLPLDAITSATPMDTIKTRLGLSETLSEIRTGPLFGSFAGAGWEWINLAFLLGGLWLLKLRGQSAPCCSMPSTPTSTHHRCFTCSAAPPCSGPSSLPPIRSQPVPHRAAGSTTAPASAC
jgi:electron transport complex protein RnfD